MRTRNDDRTRRNRPPIAKIIRRSASAAVELCRKRRIHPNAVSLGSLAAAAAAAAALLVAGQLAPTPGAAPAGLPYCLAVFAAVAFGSLRLWLNMLDGMVAEATGQTNALGEVFNELPDRASDLLIFTALAISGLCRPSLALAAAFASLLIAYTGTLAKAVGAGRQFGGVMAKPWRMVAVGAGLLVPLLLHPVWQPVSSTAAALVFFFAGAASALPGLPSLLGAAASPASGLTFVDLMLLLLLGGSLQTLWVRLRGLRRNLRRAAEHRSWAVLPRPRAAA